MTFSCRRPKRAAPESDLVGPNDTVFNFIGPPDNSWLLSRDLVSAGVPGELFPCKDNLPVANDPLFNGWPFAYCDGWMYQQTRKPIGPKHDSALFVLHDLQPGQSGSPLWIYSGGFYTIYGIMSQVTLTYNNLAHKINMTSDEYIADVIAQTS